MKEVSFIARFSGDSECFCWRTDLETYKEYDPHWIEELKYKRECNVENGNTANTSIYDDNTWLVYPGMIVRKLGLSSEKKYKITISVEEIS